MPQIESWSRFPQPVRDHLIERMRDRKISLNDLNQLRIWIETTPVVPEGLWYKDFGSFKLLEKGLCLRRFFWLGKLLRGVRFSN